MMSETKKEYIELEKDCGLKVGDEVQAIRFPKRNERGWNNYLWLPGIKTFVNRPGIIVSVTRPDGLGIVVEIDGKQAHYPYFVLQKIRHEIAGNDDGEFKYLNNDGAWVGSINAADNIVDHPDYEYVGSTKHCGRKIYSYYSGHGILYRLKE